MIPLVTRRRFLSGSLATVATSMAVLQSRPVRAQLPGERRVRVGIMGLHRGLAHIEGYLNQPGVEIAYLCDVDQRAITNAMEKIGNRQGTPPVGVSDFRRILDDRTIDAISIAAPNHWQAPATILACQAGKHVYVEKPGSHNAREAQWMVGTARRHNRLVQMGNQRRSWPHVIEAMDTLKSGVIGNLHYARSWYNADRGSIHRGKPAPIPEWLDYDLWQGPAPKRPYLDNVVHYNWHFRWHWGGGELANNGVHSLDLARWGLGVDCPSRVQCSGKRMYFDDDQETPDTTMAIYEFGDRMMEWSAHSCHSRGREGSGFGVEFLGTGGSLTLLDKGWMIHDPKGALVRESPGRWDDRLHFENFINAIRDGETLNSPISEGQKSTLLCHLGNIAWRSSSVLEMDPGRAELKGPRAARKLWGRDYRREWAPRVQLG